MKPMLPLIILLFCAFQFNTIKAQTINKNFPIVGGGIVTNVIEKDSIAYVAGNFSFIGNATRNFAHFNHNQQDVSFPQVNGFINDFEKDGENGYYLTGNIISYNDTVVNTEVLHIDKNFSIDKSFKQIHSNSAGSIQCIKRKDDNIYIGGSFLTLNDRNLNYLGVLNTDGSLSDKHIDEPSTEVDNMETSDSLLIIQVFDGGTFIFIGDYYFPSNVAAINTRTGKLSKDFLIADNEISAISVDSNKLYAGGYFKNLGYNRASLTKFIVSDTLPRSNFPSVKGIVNAIIADNNGGYFIGGNFSYIDNKPIINLSHILANGDVDESFNVNLSGVVFSLAIDDKNLYVGGDFWAGAAHNIAAIDLNTFSVTTWMPAVNSYVNAVACTQNAVYIAGNFTTVNNVKRDYVAAINKNSKLLNWHPSPNAEVTKLLINNSETYIYLLGNFSKIGNVQRDEVAKISINTGKANNWNPVFNGDVSTFSLFKNMMYVGGDFIKVNGNAHKNLAAVDTLNGEVSGFKADADATVSTLYSSGDKLYVAGDFQLIGNQSKPNIVRIDSATDTIDNWNPRVIYKSGIPINAICKKDNDLMIGGIYTFFRKAGANLIAVIDLKKKSPTPFSFAGYGYYSFYQPTAILHSNSQIFLGGYFTYTINNVNVNNLIGINDKDGSLTHSFSLYPSGSIKKLAVYDTLLIAAGSIDNIVNGFESHPAYNIVSYNLKNDEPVFDLYSAYGTTVNGIAADSVKGLIIAGYFDLINPYERSCLAAVNLNTNYVTNWNPNVTGNSQYIETIALRDSVIYIGGNFGKVGSKSRKNIAAVSLNTALATAWKPTVENVVHQIVIDDSVIYIAGDFTKINNKKRNYTAAVSASDSAKLLAWNPSPSLPVNSMQPAKNYIYLAGYFSSVGGQPRNYVAKVNKTSGAVTSWNPKPDGPVYSFAVDDTHIYMGGSFNNIAGKARNSLAAFNINSDALSQFHVKISSMNFAPQVFSISLKNENLYFGFYDFATHIINDSVRTALASVNVHTNTVTDFNPLISEGNYASYVNAQPANLYCVGEFNFKDQTIPSLPFACFTLPASKATNNEINNIAIPVAKTYFNSTKHLSLNVSNLTKQDAEVKLPASNYLNNH